MSPECQDVFTAALSDPENTTISDEECECLLENTLEQFKEWTGVEASSCGITNTLTLEEERAICRNHMMFILF